jgi:hypothetical protein
MKQLCSYVRMLSSCAGVAYVLRAAVLHFISFHM